MKLHIGNRNCTTCGGPEPVGAEYIEDSVNERTVVCPDCGSIILEGLIYHDASELGRFSGRIPHHVPSPVACSRDTELHTAEVWWSESLYAFAIHGRFVSGSADLYSYVTKQR